jgi:hypothetical protein
MSDQEWERWKATFEKGGGPMPDVVKRARTDRKRFLLGLLGLYLLSGAQIAVHIPALRHAHTVLEGGDHAIVIATVALVIASAHVAMRGAFAGAGEGPADLLAAMDRRNAGRLRLVRAIPWIMAFTVGASAAIFIARAMTHQVEVAGEIAGLVIQAAVVVFVVLVVRRFRSYLDGELRASAEARRLLAADGSEGAPGAPPARPARS